ncbi:putative F-box protein [Cardamine amara subsp. amara]|uniref:F-box protein n=1 Tax=Cardamine amara subsp. amara TaxID=228776 RepID=A0ABD0ZD68_CARAN
MNGGENLDSIPTDLTFEIFSRLPTKSIGRFRCVSKLWGSMLRCPDFTELFLTRSSARPRLLFAVEGDGECSFYSSPQPHNPYDESSLVVAADFHMKFSKDMWPDFRGFTSGLLNFSSKWKSFWPVHKDSGRVICNPITGQYAILPELIKKCQVIEYSFLGFDPIDNQFKVLLSMDCKINNHILTLGTHEKMRWRNIKYPLAHKPLCKGICINGVLYYLARSFGARSDMIVCFDVRSEKFKFVEYERLCFFQQLINYKGKLCGIKLAHVDDVIKLRLWVLKDEEKQEWLKYVNTFPKNEVLGSCKFSVAGVNARGEIVFLEYKLSKPFYAVYFNPDSNTLQRVEIQGNHEMLEKRNTVYAFVDYVEDLKFNIMKTTYAATSISPLEQKLKRTAALSTNKFDAMCLSDDDDDEFTGVINT